VKRKGEREREMRDEKRKAKGNGGNEKWRYPLSNAPRLAPAVVVVGVRERTMSCD